MQHLSQEIDEAICCFVMEQRQKTQMTWGVLGFDFNLCAFSHTAKMGLSLKKGGGTELLNMGANSQ